MARQSKRRGEDADLVTDIFKLIGAITIIPVYRYAKLFASNKPLKENLTDNTGEYFLNGLLLAMLLATLSIMGFWNCFGYKLTATWWIAGGISLLLTLCFYAGKIKRRKLADNDEEVEIVKEKPVADKDYQSIYKGLRGLGYAPDNARKSTEYVTQRFNSEPLNTKMFEAIKYFDGNKR